VSRKSTAALEGRGDRDVMFFGENSRSDNAKPRRNQHWAAAMGGNRLDGLRQLLAGDANALARLPENHPRRRPTLARVAWLEAAP